MWYWYKHNKTTTVNKNDLVLEFCTSLPVRCQFTYRPILYGLLLRPGFGEEKKIIVSRFLSKIDFLSERAVQECQPCSGYWRFEYHKWSTSSHDGRKHPITRDSGSFLTAEIGFVGVFDARIPIVVTRKPFLAWELVLILQQPVRRALPYRL